jgi:Zn-dependent M28 family amino/carboxypeptidase
VTQHRAGASNVAAVVPGMDAAAAALVIGAHYDHLGMGGAGSLDAKPDGRLHPGADDNASGVAALVELARRLAPRRGELRRSVVFAAFAGEEEGTLGSSFFVKTPPAAVRAIAAMLNLDMVGRLRGGALEVHGTGTSAAFPALVEGANRTAGLRLVLDPKGAGPSDHNAFFLAGHPVLAFTTGVHDDYHRPTDTAERVDGPGLLRIVDFVESLARALANAP